MWYTACIGDYMKIIFFAVVLPLVAILSALGTLIYYYAKKRTFNELRKEKRIKRDLELGKISKEDAVRELASLTKYKKQAKAEKAKQPLTKGQKRKKLAFQIIAMFMVVVVGAIGGFFAGSFYISSKFKTNYDFSEAQYRDNVETVLSVVGDKKPYENVGAINAFVKAEHILSQQSKYEIKSWGGLQPSIGSRQTVFAYRYKMDGVTYLENISMGMMSVAEKLIYRNGNIEKYGASNIQATTATWSTDFSSISYDDFKAENGNAIDNPIAYVVSSKTATVQQDSPTVLAGGLYQFKLVLSTDTSVMNYVKQMKRTSGLPSFPKFESVVLTFTIDENYRFTEISIVESYTVVYFGVPAFCNGDLTHTFVYDDNIEVKH